MYVLGIGCYYHDASAALLKDGVVVAAAARTFWSSSTFISAMIVGITSLALGPLVGNAFVATGHVSLRKGVPRNASRHSTKLRRLAAR